MATASRRAPGRADDLPFLLLGTTRSSALPSRGQTPSADGAFRYKGRLGARTSRNRAWKQKRDRAADTPRVEDDVLVRGKGRYIADAPGRTKPTPISCARRTPLRESSASTLRPPRGARRAWRAHRTRHGGSASIGRHPPLAGRGGKPLILPHRPALAGDAGRCMSASRSRWWSPRPPPPRRTPPNWSPSTMSR